MQTDMQFERDLLFAVRQAREGYKIGVHIVNENNEELTLRPDGTMVKTREENSALKPETIVSVRTVCVIKNCPQIWRVTESVFYVGIHAPQDDMLYVLGPAAADFLLKDELEVYQAKHGSVKEDARLPYLTATQIFNCTCVFCYLVTGASHDWQTFLNLNSAISELYASKLIAYRLDTAEKTRFSYEFELEWLEKISEGEVFWDDECIDQSAFDIHSIGKLANAYDKQMEYTYVSALTLIVRAAIRGGMEPEDCYKLSDTFFQELEHCKNTLEMRVLYMRAAARFCAEIRRAREERKYDTLAERCKHYIEKNIYEKFTVADIAHELGINANFLSNKFSKEMGTTISQYVHARRLDRSAEFLRHSGMEIDEIAAKLSFCSQSHFGRLFKERFGMTPQKYRNIHGLHSLRTGKAPAI